MKKITVKFIVFALVAVPSMLFAQDTTKVYTVNKSRCIGCAICVRNVQCPTKAITMENGKAVIDPDKCIDCGVCAIQCPVQAIYETKIEIVDSTQEAKDSASAIQEQAPPKEQLSYVVDKDVCIGCAICMRKCPVQTITMENGKSVIDSSKCNRCGICEELCPVNAISEIDKVD